MGLKMFKFTTGEDVVANVTDETNQCYALDLPVLIGFMLDGNMYAHAYLRMRSSTDMVVSKFHIMHVDNDVDPAIAEYWSRIKSITEASKKDDPRDFYKNLDPSEAQLMIEKSKNVIH